jgi:hypothetical protein
MEILSLEGDRHHANVKCITLIVGKRVTWSTENLFQWN